MIISSIKCVTDRSTKPVEIKKEYQEATFMDVKNALWEKYEIPINSQRLILCGKVVLDDETLCEKNLFAETCLILVILKNVEEQA